ncbi:hypothetical protein POTOM_055984 [Populus tomentosa]|uniref:Uncharacterized protein n=1 Tax=Populus tomentosa TaxID=118781 RepID=A0A8X7XUI1_POPTO|nr:hypothetical protein POTOM_055984 [Populus tomentosa]
MAGSEEDEGAGEVFVYVVMCMAVGNDCLWGGAGEVVDRFWWEAWFGQPWVVEVLAQWIKGGLVFTVYLLDEWTNLTSRLSDGHCNLTSIQLRHLNIQNKDLERRCSLAKSTKAFKPRCNNSNMSTWLLK